MTQPDPKMMLSMYEAMLVIRHYEETLAKRNRQGGAARSLIPPTP
ncbi:hypothetical protein [Hydrogenophaga sp.]